MGKQAPLRSPLGAVPHHASYCLSHPPPPRGKPVPGAKKGADRWLRGKPFRDPEHSFPAKELGLTERMGLDQSLAACTWQQQEQSPECPALSSPHRVGHRAGAPIFPKPSPPGTFFPKGPRQSPKDRAQQANRKAQRVPPQRSPACQKSSGLGTTQSCPTLAYIPPVTGSSLPM